jgi:hypothetical protein
MAYNGKVAKIQTNIMRQELRAIREKQMRLQIEQRRKENQMIKMKLA